MEMTDDQKKWAKRCLADMPKDVEVSVCVIANSTAKVNLHNRGSVAEFEPLHDGRMGASFEDVALSTFIADSDHPEQRVHLTSDPALLHSTSSKGNKRYGKYNYS